MNNILFFNLIDSCNNPLWGSQCILRPCSSPYFSNNAGTQGAPIIEYSDINGIVNFFNPVPGLYKFSYSPAGAVSQSLSSSGYQNYLYTIVYLNIPNFSGSVSGFNYAIPNPPVGINTGSTGFAISASYAGTASILLGSIVSSSFASTASYYNGSVISSSYSLTASYSLNGGGAALTSGSTYNITSSWSNNSNTASYYNGSVISASYAGTASVALNIPLTASYSNEALSASYANTASFALNVPSTASTAISASHAINSDSASFYNGSVLSASYALTSSHAVNFNVDTNLTVATMSAANPNNTIILNANTLDLSNQESNELSIKGGIQSFNMFVGSPSFVGIESQTGSLSLNAVINKANVGIGTVIPKNTLDVVGNISCSVITASFFGTASWSNTASMALNYNGSVASASYALTASYAPFSQSFQVSSSYANTASFSLNVPSTASYSLVALSASYAPSSPSISSSFATTSSYAGTASILLGSIISASYSLSSSYGATASYVSPYELYVHSPIANNFVTVSFQNTNQVLNLVNTGSYNFTASNISPTGSVSDVLIYISASYPTGTSSLSFPTNWINIGSGFPTTISAGTNGVIWLRSLDNGNVIGTYNISGSTYSASYAISASYAPSSPSISASYAATASVLLGSITSASYALSSSYAPSVPTISASYAGTASVLLGSVVSASHAGNSDSASYYNGSVLSSSYANNSTTASLALNYNGSVVSSSFSQTSSYALNAPTINTGSFVTTSSFNSYSSSVVTELNNKQNTIGTGSLLPVTASVAISSSYAPVQISASYANTASVALIYNGSVNSSSYSLTASYAPSISSSYANTSSFALTVPTSGSAVLYSNSGSIGSSSLFSYIPSGSGNNAPTLQLLNSNFQVQNVESSMFTITNENSAFSIAGFHNMPLYVDAGITGNNSAGLTLATSDGVGITMVSNNPGSSLKFLTNTTQSTMVMVNGQVSCSVITASLFNGTASYSISTLSASYAPSSPSISSSYSLTASYALNAPTASNSSSYALSSSYSLNASNAVNATNSVNATIALSATSASYATQASTASFVSNYYNYVSLTTSSANYVTVSFSNPEQTLVLSQNKIYNFTQSNVSNAGQVSDVLLYLSSSISSGTASFNFPSNWINIGGGWPANIAANELGILWLRSLDNGNVIGTYSVSGSQYSASYALTATSASYAPGSPSVSSSYSLTASYALNGGSGGSSTASYLNTVGGNILGNGQGILVNPTGSENFEVNTGDGNGELIFNANGEMSLASTSYIQYFSFTDSDGTLVLGDVASSVNQTQLTINDSAKLSTFNNNLQVNGNLDVSGVITASLFFGTASYASKAISASYAPSSPSISASYAATASYISAYEPYVSTPVGSNNYVTVSFLSPNQILKLTNTASYNFTASNISTTGSVSDALIYISASFTSGTSSFSYPSNWSNIGSGFPSTINAGTVGVIWLRSLDTGNIIGTYNISGSSSSASYALTATTASYALNGGGSSLTTGSTYPITASWSNNSNSGSVNTTGVNQFIYIHLSPSSSGMNPTFVDTGLTFNPSTNTLLTSFITASSVTASLYGTSSWSSNVISASHAITASYALNYNGTVISASYSLSSSYAPAQVSSSYSSTASVANNLSSTAPATASVYIVTGSCVTNQTGSYTLNNGDNGAWINVISASTINITVPPGLNAYFNVSLFQSSSGKIDVANGGVTILNSRSNYSSFGQYSVINLFQIQPNVFVLSGDTGPT